MTDDEADELRQLAARMYMMVKDCEDVSDCLEPTGVDDACPPCGCSDCGWWQDTLRDSLLRLGCDI